MTKFSEKPTLCNKTVYQDSELKITKKWSWNVKAVYEDKKTQVCKALLDGEVFNNGKSTFVSYQGDRLTDIEMDWVYDSKDTMWLFAIKGKGYGFFDKDINLVVPPKYQRADDFYNGYAPVHDGKEWLFVDKKGNEIRLKNKYERLGYFSNGLARVSTLWIGEFGLAYCSDYSDDAGTWGYVDEEGNEVIKPQYIYAFDFVNDRAIVAKGKWTIDKKWDNEYNQGRYWTEEELWGVIDKNGNEIIPCIYDEIKQFTNNDFSTCEDYYQVHVGGWKEGKWAIIDRNGNFVTEPIFEDVYFDYFNGMFTYREENTYEDIPLGIYDLNTNKVLFEPQFDDVSFLDDGNIRVEVFDEDLGHKIEKVIDITGRELFKSDYTDIYTWENPCIAIKKEVNTTTYNLIDKSGNVIDGTVFNDKVSYWDSAINFETRTYIYSENEKLGLKHFDGTIIIPAQYEYFRVCPNNSKFYYYEISKDSNKEGLMKADGTILIQPKYRNIMVLSNNKIICNGTNGVDMYEYETK